MLKPFRRAPLLRPALFLIAGIITQYYHDVYRVLPVLLLLSLVFFSCAFIPYFNQRYSFRWLFGAGLLLLCFAVGSLSTRKAWAASEWPVADELHAYRARITDEPVLKPKTYQCKLEILSADSLICEQVQGRRVIAYLPIDERSGTLTAGDAIIMKATLSKPTPLLDADFDYPLYLRKQKQAATGFVRAGDWQLTDIPIPWSEIVQYKALEVRRVLLTRLRGMLTDDRHYAVAAALVFGYKSELDKDLKQRFANTGAGHILAVSGLHFNILFGMLFFFFSFLDGGRRRRLLRLLLVLPLIWGFAFLTGFSPSVNRAAWMMTIWIVGHTFFFRTFTLNTIAIAALFMLLYNPLYLFNVSFQLSFMAVIAIVLFYPRLRSILRPRNKLLVYSWEMVCVSTAAQIGVLPLAVYYFHQLPLIFLVTNLLIIPLATLLLYLIPFSLLLSFAVGWEIASPMDALMRLFLNTIEWLDSIPQASFSGIYIDAVQTLLLYLCLISMALLWVKKRVVWLYTLLVFVLMLGLYYFC